MPLPANSISIPTFSPLLAIIIAITRANGCTIQTTQPITFIVGQSVKIIIPPPVRATLTNTGYDYGMHEINGMIGNIVFINPLLPNFFRTDIDTTFFTPFVLPGNATQFAQAIPYAEENDHLDGAWRNALPPV